jgi:hypothetical protein
LFGVTSTIARTRPSISASASAGSGTKPASARQGSARGSTPSIASDIWWLKYQGVGRMTASPCRAISIMAAKNAMLQPAVTATSAGSTRPP